jgi:hypothetical protein
MDYELHMAFLNLFSFALFDFRFCSCDAVIEIFQQNRKKNDFVVRVDFGLCCSVDETRHTWPIGTTS